jgi:TRAP-type C4-dicarboxylate transport system permease small subunit
MIGLAGMQIVLRNLLDTGFPWSDPLLRVLVLWISLMGAMVASRDDNHITVDVLSRFLPIRIRSLSRGLTDLFTAIVCALLAYHGLRFVLLDKQAGTLAFASVPAWICELVIPVGFGVIALRFFLSLFQHISDAIKPEDTPVRK